MPKPRILVVDDSALVRKMVSMAIELDADLELVGTAPNGLIALTKLERLSADVVVLDVEMPQLSGLETLQKLREHYPSVKVVMFSSLTASGSLKAMEALSLGASDCVVKPAQSQGLDESLEFIRENLLTKIRGLCHLSLKPASGWSPAAPAASWSGGPALKSQTPSTPAAPQAPRPNSASPLGVSIPTASRNSGPIDLVVIGISTGGPNALAELMPSFTQNFPVPILIVQHMPPMFTKLLAERLCTRCPLEVREALHGEEIGPGQVRLAPGNFHMTVTRKDRKFLLGLNQDAPENSCRPAVDVLFRSAASACHNRVLAAILTGMGQDGLRGCESIRAEGGQIISQDEATSVVWGMPGAVAQAGLTEKILPLLELGPEINRRVGLRIGVKG